VGSPSSSGFIGNFVSKTNVTFEDFTIRNVTFNGESPFIFINNANSMYYDTSDWMTGLTMKNGNIKYMFENNTNALAGLGSYANSYFVNSLGPSLLTIYNLTVSHVFLKSKPVLGGGGGV